MMKLLAGILTVVLFMSAWVTHIVYCFIEGAWGFLIAGAVMVPIGWFHGFGLWFGWW